MSRIRRRRPETLLDASPANETYEKCSETAYSESRSLDNLIERPHKLFFLLCPLLVVSVVYFIVSNIGSDCWSCSGSSWSSDFDVATARSHLVKVTDLGPRTAGSAANEVAAADYIRNELKSIAAIADGSELQVLFDEHISNYSSFRAFFHISSYNNVRNFALRFHDFRAKNGNTKKSAFLINCHYDTAPGSPGASDAFVNCAVMLEVSRILATGSYILSNDLVFLFNGAEESLLLSSHAFITQHSWADDIVAFMNLEGAGAGKRLLLFQTGPGQSSEVLLDAYANSFRQPYASIFGEDVFQFGLIPSDTDYRIFRDYGS
ncbi:unnamed protein product [Heterobilharzia americana]|nr:unnamed protein product [Heterobilharzia americana]